MIIFVCIISIFKAFPVDLRMWCAILLAIHLESQSHARNVTSLQSELERERLAHQEAMLTLSTGMSILTQILYAVNYI